MAKILPATMTWRSFTLNRMPIARAPVGYEFDSAGLDDWNKPHIHIEVRRIDSKKKPLKWEGIVYYANNPGRVGRDVDPQRALDLSVETNAVKMIETAARLRELIDDD